MELALSYDGKLELRKLLADAEKKIKNAMRGFSQKEKKCVITCIDALKALRQFLEKNQSLLQQLMTFLKDKLDSILKIVGISPAGVEMEDLEAAGIFCRVVSAELEFI